MVLHNLDKKNLPFVYRFSFEQESNSLVIHINPEVIPRLALLNPDNLIIRPFKVLNFETDLNKNFGLNNCSDNKGVIDGLLTLKFPITPLLNFGEKICSHCHGSKKHKYSDMDCPSCRLTGKEKIYNHSLNDIADSLGVLLNYLNYIGLYIENDKLPETSLGYQSVIIDTLIGSGRGGCAIGGEVSITFLKTIFSKNINEISKKVSETRHHIYLITENQSATPDWNRFEDKMSFPCWLNTNYLSIHLQVPGDNNCSIHIKNNGEVTDHNIDHAQQQLELLCGFGVLSSYV